MLMAEELALVALDPDRGRHELGERSQLNAALAGLLLVELVAEGYAGPDPSSTKDDRIAVAPDAGTPTSELLAAALEVVAEAGPKTKAILSAMDRGLTKRLGAGTWDSTLAELERAGVVGEPSGLLKRRDVLDLGRRAHVLARLQAAAAGTGPIEPRTAMVLSMTGPAQLLEEVAPERSQRKHARRRIDSALDGSELAGVGKAVRGVIQEAAAMAAGTGFVAITASGS